MIWRTGTWTLHASCAKFYEVSRYSELRLMVLHCWKQLGYYTLFLFQILTFWITCHLGSGMFLINEVILFGCLIKRKHEKNIQSWHLSEWLFKYCKTLWSFSQKQISCKSGRWLNGAWSEVQGTRFKSSSYPLFGVTKHIRILEKWDFFGFFYFIMVNTF